MIKIDLDLSELKTAVKKTPRASAEALQSGMKEIKNEWVKDAKSIAPVKDGYLRDSITGEVSGLEVEVGVKASDLKAKSKKDFNYAYYIHDDKGKAVTGEKKFLDVSAKQNEGSWKSELESKLVNKFNGLGW